jgi:hypothetical protein
MTCQEREVPCVTWNRMNLQTKMSEMGAMCQLREDSKDTHVLRLASLKGLGKVESRYLRVSGFQSFLSLRLIETPKREAPK